MADVSASVDSSDRRRLWRIRLAQQVACQRHPSHHFSPRTSESSTIPCKALICTLSSVLKEMGFKHTAPLRLNFISVPLLAQTGSTIGLVSAGLGNTTGWQDYQSNTVWTSFVLNIISCLPQIKISHIGLKSI